MSSAVVVVVVIVVVVMAVDLVEETVSEEIDGPFYSQPQQQLYHDHKKVSRTVNYLKCSASSVMISPTIHGLNVADLRLVQPWIELYISRDSRCGNLRSRLLHMTICRGEESLNH